MSVSVPVVSVLCMLLTATVCVGDGVSLFPGQCCVSVASNRRNEEKWLVGIDCHNHLMVSISEKK